jgi:hypothetical protein
MVSFMRRSFFHEAVFGRESMERQIKVDGIGVECVQEFVYLGSLLTWDNDCSREIRKRIAQAT